MTSAQWTAGRGEAGRLLAPIAELACAAGARILECAAGDLAARAKSDASPVTTADHAAEEILLAGLARILPGVPVVAEEAMSRGEAVSLNSAYLLVDPIDGTRELIEGRDEYTVNVALIVGHRPVLGIVHAPAQRALYAGAEGRALRATPDAGGRFELAAAQPIRVRPRPGRLVAAVSRSHPDPASDAFLARLPVERKIAIGSSLKFARVAEGSADVYARLARTNEWDIAAGHALLAAAGGSVLAPDGGELIYGKRADGFGVDGFVAWGAPPDP